MSTRRGNKNGASCAFADDDYAGLSAALRAGGYLVPSHSADDASIIGQVEQDPAFALTMLTNVLNSVDSEGLQQIAAGTASEYV